MTGPQNHAHPHPHPSRRGLLRLAGALGGAALFETSLLRAAEARALAQLLPSRDRLFDLEKVADGIFAAIARPQAILNANAAIFVGKRDVLVVDTHSKPSAAAALVAQIRREITPLPVRTVVNSHFHWDHSQGNSAYAALPGVRLVASETTRELMAEKYTAAGLKGIVEELDRNLEKERQLLGAAVSADERAFHKVELEQMEAYARELRRFQLALPDLTFRDTLVLHDPAHTLVLSFPGRAHTAGDVIVYCPEKKVVATGDVLHGWLPFMADSFPREWPRTLDHIAELPWTRAICGHGPVQADRFRLTHKRAYIQELTERVVRGRAEGRSIAQLQKTITVGQLRSLAADGYGELVLASYRRAFPWIGTPPGLEKDVESNIAQLGKRIEAGAVK